jgi:PAS domain S-box-containing protein
MALASGGQASVQEKTWPIRIWLMNTANDLCLEHTMTGANSRPVPCCADWSGLGNSGHFVQFYENDAFLAKSVASFVGSGLTDGGSAIVIATENHRSLIEAELGRDGIDLFAAREANRYHSLDAAETLEQFMIEGAPDKRLFQQVIGGLVNRVTASGMPLRAFGEMVALLWADGNGAAAIQLEELWNDLAKTSTFSLFCAYPMRGFSEEADGQMFAHICQEHSRVFPTESYPLERDTDHRLRAIARLQQRANSLETEIANRIEAEQKLVASQRELSDFLENALDGIHRVGPDGTILWANRAELELLGFSATEYLGHNIAEFHVDQAVIEGILSRLKRGERLRDQEACLRCKDGSIRHVSINSTAYREGDRFLHTQCITRDITDRKLAAQVLEHTVAERTVQLQELVGELEAFSYGISHDLRAPLRAMRGYARSLIDDYAKHLDADAVERLNRIERASTRLDLLVRDVLAYSTISRRKIDLKPVALKPLIEDVLHQDPEFQKNRRFISIDGVSHTVLGHEAYLMQCFSNLIGNALKFVARGEPPNVRITSERIDDRIRVTVSDNGIGIQPEHHDRIFKMFGRVYSEKDYAGTGIGLVIARKAVLRMGGEIGFISPAGQGTEFKFSLAGIPK